MDIGLADFGVGFVYGIVYKGGNKVYLNLNESCCETCGDPFAL